jgi:heme/copper-type cytochrome/quinol oxidase subunit 2
MSTAEIIGLFIIVGVVLAIFAVLGISAWRFRRRRPHRGRHPFDSWH